MKTCVSGGCRSSIILAKKGVDNLEVLQVRSQTGDDNHQQKQKRHLFWKIKTIFSEGIFSRGLELNGWRKHFLKKTGEKEEMSFGLDFKFLSSVENKLLLRYLKNNLIGKTVCIYL